MSEDKSNQQEDRKQGSATETEVQQVEPSKESDKERPTVCCGSCS
ncbi:hypothetical protein [uncultured Neptuniibacter sp.]|nr:hypothetical protein [uncultured Neptuniibacter sp.]